MIRVAAAGDLHVGLDSVGTIRSMLGDVGDRADVLLLAGDLTRRGTAEEAEVAGRGGPRPRRAGRRRARQPRPPLRPAGRGRRRRPGRRRHRARGRQRRRSTSTARRLGVAGVKGFGGGFAGAQRQRVRRAGDEGVRPAHARARRPRSSAALVACQEQGADVRVALLHYSPVRRRCRASRPRSTRSSAATCWPRPSTGRAPTWPCTATPTAAPRRASRRGVRVRNVAQPVIKAGYKVYTF